MNNPPAFPVFPETGGGHAAAFQGMTLRDYFASKAIIGIALHDVPDEVREVITKDAYKWADAMLKAREA